MTPSQQIPDKGRMNYRLVIASTLIVMGVVLLTALFNQTSLEKLYFDVFIKNVSNDTALLSRDLDALSKENYPTAGDKNAIIQNHYTGIQTFLGNTTFDTASIVKEGHLSVSLASESGTILSGSDPNLHNTTIPTSVLRYLNNVHTHKNGDGYIIENNTVYIGYPIGTPMVEGETFVLVSFHRDMTSMSLANSVNSERQLFWILFGASILLMLVVILILPKRALNSQIARKRTYTTTICFCIAFQIVFSLFYGTVYRAQLLKLVHNNGKTIHTELVHKMGQISSDESMKHGATLQKDIQTVAKSVLSKREDVMGISLTPDNDSGLHPITIETASRTTSSSVFGALYDHDRLIFKSRWTLTNAGSGEIRVLPSTRFLNHMLSEMVMDIITVLVISILLLMELIFLLKASFEKETSKSDQTKTAVNYILMRPAMFLFLFAIDLSMSFIPIYMERLYEPMFGLSRDVILGLPITIEFIFVGFAIFGTGYWVDRRGWHEPFIVGLLLSALGVIYSWLAPDGLNFILSRGVIGVGYGLALMASQGFVITFTDLKTKALGLAQLFAGIYAGSICGGAAGAMLADRFGFSVTFQIGAAIIIGIIAYTFAFMRHAIQKPMPSQSSPSASPAAPSGNTPFSDFIRNRIIISLILLSSFPASVAIVGFLNYFCPLYLNGLGVTQSSIGRILMIYGVSLVYFGPIVGKYTDRSNNKKMFVLTGCLLGSMTFLIFYFVQGILAAILALLLLGLSSCFVLSSQSAYMLNLQVTRNFGQGKAIGIFRSTSRLGQALGPIVFSALIFGQTLESGIILFGLFYLLTALLFFIFTRSDSHHLIEDSP